MSYPPIILQVMLAALVLVAAVYDWRFRRIPNWLTLSGVLAGIGVNWFIYWDQVRYPREALLGLGLAFLVYFPLYLIRGMGAGDVKLMAAVGAIVGPWNWFGIFVASNILGGIAAIFMVMSKGRLWSTIANVGFMLNELAHFRPPYLRKEELDLSSPKAVKMPHGLAIAFGSLAFLAAVWMRGLP
jgi:prepilin peptidase CpaA